MDELRKMENLRKFFTDDSRAVKIFDQLCKENRKSIKRYTCVLSIVIIGITLITFSIIISNKNLFCIGIIAIIVAMIYAILPQKEILTSDELRYLNAILKEKSFANKGEIPFIQKSEELFYEKDGELIYIGKAEDLPNECSQYIYKKIEDYDDIAIPRFRVEENLEFAKIKGEKEDE